MYIDPQAAHFNIETTPDGLRAIVPAKRNWIALLFISVWLVGWFVAEMSAVREFIESKDLGSSVFFVLWLTGWSIGGVFAFVALLWQLAGREVITVNFTTFSHKVEILRIGRTREYRTPEVKNLRVVGAGVARSFRRGGLFPPITGSGSGPIAFDYGTRTYRIAAALDAAEASTLAQALSTRLPRTL